MILLFILIVTAIVDSSFGASVEEYKTYKNHRIYKVEGSNEQVNNFVQKIKTQIKDLPYHSVKQHEAHLLIAPELVTDFEQAVLLEGLVASIVVEDYSEIIRLEKSGNRNAGFGWKAYYDVDHIYKYLEHTSKANPEWTEVIVGGQSYEGRKILGLRINTPSEKKEGKPVVFIESGIHAREWITPATTTYFINELLTNQNQNITNLRDQFDWRIFPTVNPDGYQFSFKTDRMWRKTRSRSPNSRCVGADPNRNWDYNWMQQGTSSNPCDYQTYGGDQPFSEIETKSLSEYLAGIENLLAYVAFHSDAQMLLLPYSDSKEEFDNYDDLFKIGQTSLQYGYEVNREKYRGPGTAAQILYPVSGGSMDWVRHKLGTPLVFTYELRGLWFHWPPEKIHEQGDEYTQMMVGLFAEAKNLGYF